MDILNELQAKQRLARLKVAKRCQHDLFYFCKNILDYDLMEELTHGGICRYTEGLLPYSAPLSKEKLPVMEYQSPPQDPPQDADKKNSEEKEGKLKTDLPQDAYDPQKKFLLILMPRGTFKSSIVTIGFALQTILSDPDARILIDSETFSKSKAFLAEIKGHLEDNEKFRDIYHTFYGSYPDDKKRDGLWTDSQLNISARKRQRKEPTFSCSGVDVTKTGMHYDLIIMDDLMSETNVTTREQIQKVIDHYKLGLSLLDPGKPLIVIGTRWHYSDVYQYILDYEGDRFNRIIRQAYNPDGSLFFPQRLTEEFLKAQKKSQGSYIFSCQYMNNPVDDETAIFRRSWIHYKETKEIENIPINWYLLVDPSFAGDSSDYAAFVVAGMDHMRNIYVRHVTREKMTYAQIIQHMFDLFNRFEVKQISLETVATQKSIMYELNNEQKRRGVWLPVKEINHRSKSKEERVRGLAPAYEFGHVFHLKGMEGGTELEYELLHFPKAKHDDVVDALADILDIAAAPSHLKSKKRKKNPKFYDKPRSVITGV